MPSDEEFQAYWFGGCGTVVAFAQTGTGSLELAGAHYVKGLLKKVASGVLAIFPCSRTKRTLRAKKRLRPCWTDFFEPTRSHC
ncbi:hypothetical protein [Candidatus Nitrospira allomarina]|uniref:Uncharacterized protein n=1 Tax=Candidatus Nitrospira allomarina TaxID=3020900 RepID=A0AA96JRY9_9BACT|nr:hypothetical protein [Candidatus Nitrospira allomarina]WNM58047.1 hypothetical protein PP769_19075 [Candidatus Nitrospira allomarina]